MYVNVKCWAQLIDETSHTNIIGSNQIFAIFFIARYVCSQWSRRKAEEFILMYLFTNTHIIHECILNNYEKIYSQYTQWY